MIRVIIPSDAVEAEAAVKAAYDHDGPVEAAHENEQDSLCLVVTVDDNC